MGPENLISNKLPGDAGACWSVDQTLRTADEIKTMRVCDTQNRQNEGKYFSRILGYGTK